MSLGGNTFYFGASARAEAVPAAATPTLRRSGGRRRGVRMRVVRARGAAGAAGERERAPQRLGGAVGA